MTDIASNPTARERAREMMRPDGILYSPAMYRQVIGELLLEVYQLDELKKKRGLLSRIFKRA